MVRVAEKLPVGISRRPLGLYLVFVFSTDAEHLVTSQPLDANSDRGQVPDGGFRDVLWEVFDQ
jgi:hypothetical protein